MSDIAIQTKRVQLSTQGLELGDQTIPLLSGEIHYFHHEPQMWGKLLDALLDLGLTAVSSYVPWGLHEKLKGKLDFGERSTSLDLARFIRLSGERGLWVILRPGPHINAELNWLGLPKWLLEKFEVQARTPQDNPVWLPINPRPLPVPSYASSVFLRETDAWLRAVAEQIAPFQWPTGPLVAVQLDNEAPHVFRNGPFEQDYHPESIAIFQQFTEDRGRRVDAAPRTLKRGNLAELRLVMDWVESRCEVYARALTRMRATLQEAGLKTVLFTHNVAQGGVIPEVAPSLFSAAEMIGFDFYHERQRTGLLRERCRYAVGSSKLPFAAELGIGGPWNLPVRSTQVSLDHFRAILASGFRAFNLFMAADRDRYYGAPLTSAGKKRTDGIAKGLELLISRYKQAHLQTLRPLAPIAIVVPRIYTTMNHATWVLGPVTPPALQVFGLKPELGVSEDTHGLDEPIHMLWGRNLAELVTALRTVGLGSLIVDGDGCASRLDEQQPSIVIALCYQMIERGLLAELLAQAKKGKHVVFLPRIPSLDENLQDLGSMLPPELSDERHLVYGRGSINLHDATDAVGLREVARDLASRISPAPVVWTEESAYDVTVLTDGTLPRVIGIVEREGREGEVKLCFSSPLKLREIEAKTPIKNGRVGLAPFGAILLEVLEVDGCTLS